MKEKGGKIYFGFLLALLWAIIVKPALAGFGVSPPSVWNDHLVPGAHFEQVIYIVRGTPDEMLEARIQFDAPEIKDWIKIEQGDKFTLPQGVQQFPMKVIIDVPRDAGYAVYEGFLRVMAVAVKEGGEEQMTGASVALGSRVSIKLRVSSEEYSDFKIKGIRMEKIEEEWPMKVAVNMENLGNIKTRPSKVKLSVFSKYDNEFKKELFSAENGQSSWIEPFSSGESISEFQHKLAPDDYWALVIIYKDDKEYIRDKIYLEILPKWGIVPKPFWLKAKDWMTASIFRIILLSSLTTFVAVALAAIVLFFLMRKKKTKKMEVIMTDTDINNNPSPQ